MRKFLITLISGFAFLFLGALGIGALLPQDFSVEREIVVFAPKERVFLLISDLERWETWGPFKDKDPSLEVTFGERTSGIGASQRWVGQDGDGRLVFTSADPDRGVEFDLFFNQDAFANRSAIVYEETAEGLRVRWRMSGSVPVPVLGGYLAKMMPGFVSPMFDNGLAKLKTAAEEPALAR